MMTHNWIFFIRFGGMRKKNKAKGRARMVPLLIQSESRVGDTMAKK